MEVTEYIGRDEALSRPIFNANLTPFRASCSEKPAPSGTRAGPPVHRHREYIVRRSIVSVSSSTSDIRKDTSLEGENLSRIRGRRKIVRRERERERKPARAVAGRAEGGGLVVGGGSGDGVVRGGDRCRRLGPRRQRGSRSCEPPSRRYRGNACVARFFSKREDGR